MRDRTKIVTLAVVTVPLAWYALSGAADRDARLAGRVGAAVPSAEPVTAAPPPTPAPPTPAPPAPAAGAPADPPVVEAGSGTTAVVPGGTAASGPGRVTRYTVAVEEGLGVDAPRFAAEVDRTLADPRSWGHGGDRAFQRVDAGPVDVRVVLASPTLTDRMCRPLRTLGRLSCGSGSTAVLNSYRWLQGADAYTGRLPEYRQYVVNHEVGHTLGHGHEGCPAPGRLAPVMMQQTKGVGACRPSPWPYP